MVPAGEDWRDIGESYFRPGEFLPSNMWQDIQNSRKRLVYWGRLKYRDLVEDSKSAHAFDDLKEATAVVHETCFCYFWSPPLNEFLACGPVGYNRHT